MFIGQKCKEKYKNIRSVVGRYKKQIDSGVKKRPYYLMEHMRYAFPYIKSFQNKSTNKTTKANDTLLYEEIDHEEELTGVKIEGYGSPYPESPQYYMRTPSPSLEIYADLPSLSPMSETADQFDQPRRLKKTNSGSNQSKPQTNSDTPSLPVDLPNELQNDPKKMFLLSLLPDLYAMNDKQTRKFKREVLKLVDDILSDV